MNQLQSNGFKRAKRFYAGFLLGMASVILVAAVGVRNSSAAERPNVIVIFTDDQSVGDVGCYLAEDIQTPGIDSIAEQGVRFTQFYAASPVCSPSRVGLLTGRYPWIAGLDGNAGNGPGEEINDLTEAEDRSGLPGREVTLAEMFKEAGYATAHIGKWHLGHGDGMKPSGDHLVAGPAPRENVTRSDRAQLRLAADPGRTLRR